MNAKDLDAYFAELNARKHTAEPIGYRDVSTALWSPIKAECHPNVDHFVSQHPNTRAVRGWVIMSENELGGLFIAHSVVEEDGEVYDITSEENSGLRFFRHLGTEEDFRAIIQLATFYFYPQVTQEQFHEENVLANLEASSEDDPW